MQKEVSGPPGMESGKLVKVDRAGKGHRIYSLSDARVGPLCSGCGTRKRNLIWFSEIFADKIVRFDPGSNSFVEFPQPSADSDVRRIEIDRNRPNRVWWSSGSADKIGYIELVE